MLLARAFAGDPGLVLLDEPAAGLDLGGREDLVARLGRVAHDTASPATVLVTHHVEEVPPGTTHALLLRAGRVAHQGPLDSVLTGSHLSQVFDLPLEVERRGDRWSARRPKVPASWPSTRPAPLRGALAWCWRRSSCSSWSWR